MSDFTITSAVRSVTPVTSTEKPALTDDQKKLRKAATDLEGLFVAQLFRAMRETVPKNDGFVSGGSGEEIFTGLMDEHIAAETPSHWGGGISEALYRQLSRGLPAASAAGVPTSSSTIQDVQTSNPLRR
ncbi:MAG: rod-binding protein [Phycisphaerae bacterium]|nr:rod-binding protein [Gemmatimonadaceae bacterium]